KALAVSIGCSFFDADDFHSIENVEKMRSGKPLDDDDRGPWLDTLRSLMETELRAGRRLVLACSALRESYRKRLISFDEQLASHVTFVYLDVTPGTAERRLLSRIGHYMPSALVPSQFQALEEPNSALWVDAGAPVQEILSQIDRLLADRL